MTGIFTNTGTESVLTGPRIRMLAHARKTRHLATHERQECNVESESDKREQRSKKRRQRREEREEDVCREREEERKEGQARSWVKCIENE